MPGTYAHAQWVAQDCLRLLTNGLIAADFFDTTIEKEFKKNFAVGDEVTFKYPDQGTIREGLTYVGSSPDRRTGTVKVDNIIGTDLDMDSIEMMFDAERSEAEIREQYIKPRIRRLLTEFELRAFAFIEKNCTQVTGTLGTAYTTLQTFNGARTRLFEQSLWGGKVGLIVPPSVMEAVGPQVLPYMQPADEVSKFFKQGSIGQYAGMRMYESMCLPRHTAGIWAGTVETSSGGQSGNTLALTATNGDTVKMGNKFTLENVNAFNPDTRRVTGRARVFTVLNDATAAASAFASGAFTFSPSIITSGPYQNVDAGPVNGADLTMFPGTTSAAIGGKTGTLGFAITKDFAFMVGMPLPMPAAHEVAISKQETDPDTGLSIAIIKSWDNVARRYITRFDTVFGFGVKYSDGAVAIAGA